MTQADGMTTVLAMDRALAANLRAPRYGYSNPERIENAFWDLMIRMRWNAHRAATVFQMESEYDACQGPAGGRDRRNGPIFCFTRAGRTVTPLRDGRVVYVGGEHEDWYDVNFCIYNDVVVESPDGKLDVYAYPSEDFSPTDFHSATLVGDDLYLIGSLGYADQRIIGETPVSVLETKGFSISSMMTFGTAPGRIYGHTAEYDRNRHAISVEGGMVVTAEGKQPYTRRCSLDLESGFWNDA